MVLAGTPAAVRVAAERFLREAMKGGGYILSTASSVAPASPPENILPIAAAAEAAGRYEG